MKGNNQADDIPKIESIFILVFNALPIHSSHGYMVEKNNGFGTWVSENYNKIIIP